jgi:hypothetical protein
MEKEVLEVLSKFGYVVFIDNKPVFTKKFKDLNTETENRSPIATMVMALPSKMATLEEKKAVWNQFIKDADIPHRVTATTGGVYTVRQFNKPAADRLWRIVSDPGIDYDTFVSSTKNYYKTVTYKRLLTNYLLDEVWKDEYEEWKKKGTATTADGSSWIES